MYRKKIPGIWFLQLGQLILPGSGTDANSIAISSKGLETSQRCDTSYNRTIQSFNATTLESALFSFKQATDSFKRIVVIAQTAQSLKLLDQTSRRLGGNAEALHAFRQALRCHLSGQVTDQAGEAR